MTIAEYLRRLEIKRLVLGCEWHDVRVCVSPMWHRREWYHAGQQRYVCAICERLQPEVA